MSEPNPYQSPDVSPVEIQITAEWDSTLEDASRSLAQTKPWVLLLSILGFIGTALTIVFIPVVLFLGGGNELGGPVSLAMLLPVLMMMGMAVLVYLIPSLLLWRYGRQIGRFLKSRNPDGFAAAIAAQKRFWQYVGILAVLITAFYAIILAGFVALPVFMRLMG